MLVGRGVSEGHMRAMGERCGRGGELVGVELARRRSGGVERQGSRISMGMILSQDLVSTSSLFGGRRANSRMKSWHRSAETSTHKTSGDPIYLTLRPS